MTKQKSTKRALLLSALSLLMCVSMLIGSTFAWFTDSVTSKNNIIKSGNLDVELYYQVEGQEGWTKVTEKTNVFMENAYWEPGHTEVVKLKVVNEGSLALRYKLGVNIVSETSSVNVLGDEFKLSEFIKYGIVEGEKTFTRKTAIEAVDATATDLNTIYGSDSIALSAGDNKVVTMVVYMPESVDNRANHKTGENVPLINLGINLYATQLAYESESDSFGSDYDKNATYDAPGVIIRDDMTGPIAAEIAANTSLDGYIPQGLPENVELNIELAEVGVKKLSYNVSPSSETDGPVTFRLPIPESYDQGYVDVSSSIATFSVTTTLGVHQIQGEGNGKFIEVTTVAPGLITIQDAVVENEGVYGGVDWELYSDGTLVIAPTKGQPVADQNSGKTYEVGAWREAVKYDSKGNGTAVGGWPYDRNKVTKLIIEEGVTSIGSFTAQFYTNLTGEVVIPSTVTYIGQEAFQGSTMTKLTFAKVPEGKEGKELRVAHGAFKNLIIEEVALPDDRPVTLHCWAFLMCTNLKSITIPTTIGDLHGCDEIDYFKSPSVSANVTWTQKSQIVGGYNDKRVASNPNMETIIFGNEAARNKFYSYSDNKLGNTGAVATVVSGNTDVIIDCASIEIAANLAQAGDTIILLKDSNEEVVLPAGVTLDTNGKTAPNVTKG